MEEMKVIRIPESVHKQAKAAAAIAGKPLNEFIAELIKAALQKPG